MNVNNKIKMVVDNYVINRCRIVIIIVNRNVIIINVYNNVKYKLEIDVSVEIEKYI